MVLSMIEHRTALLDQLDPLTGMNPLHLAIGRNNLPMTKMLVEAGAKFIPDKQGRMPSIIALECEASEELQDYVLEVEGKVE